LPTFVQNTVVGLDLDLAIIQIGYKVKSSETKRCRFFETTYSTWMDRSL